MTGETDLARLLASMRPVLAPDIYVFATVPPGAPLPLDVDPLMTFREQEGRTLILTQAEAEAAALPFVFPSRMITLDVYSSLEAVGFIAAIAARLAAAGIGVNPVAGYFHDHLFVPENRVEEAMEILAAITTDATPLPREAGGEVPNEVRR